MRMRFWATMRRPAFSISALTAPVRLRAVASGLMIEKVRSIAMVFGPQINGMWSWPRLYRWLARRQALWAQVPVAVTARIYNIFATVEAVRERRWGESR